MNCPIFGGLWHIVTPSTEYCYAMHHGGEHLIMFGILTAVLCTQVLVLYAWRQGVRR